MSQVREAVATDSRAPRGAATRRTRAARTRARILAAAEERFARLGYAATRLEDVGVDVGVGRSAVLYHFADKQRLYRAVLDEIVAGFLDALRPALVAKGSLADRLEAAVCAFVRFVGRHPTLARIAIRESVASDPQAREELQRQAHPFHMLLEMMFEEGRSSGELRPLRSDPLHFLSTIAGSTLFYVAALPTFVADLPFDPLSEEELRAHERDMLEVTRTLLGIRGPRGAADPRSMDPKPRHGDTTR